MKKFNLSAHTHTLTGKSSILASVFVLFALGLTGLVIAANTVSLGTADNFAVLAGSGITDTNPSVVTGDVGLSPTGGAAIGITAGEVTGTIYNTDGIGPGVQDAALLTGAKTALNTAYTAASQPTTGVISADLGGQTLTPGVYEDNNAPDSLGITGVLTLNGGGDPNAVFIFKTGSTLTTAAGSEVSLINGAQACNVFWQIGSSATLGVGSIFKGNILAFASITDNGGSTIEGRLLARTGAVTLNDTTLTRATCVAPPPTPGVSGSGGTTFALIPNINITKIPSPLALPMGPGPVTFTYAVTNIGQVAMSNVWVKDDKCLSVVYVSGDANNDSKLDMRESWTYRCTKTVSKTETNTAIAHGSYNGWETYDNANATVVVNLSLVPPLIHLVKTPSTYTLPAGGGPVMYSYAVTNPGTAPLSNVSIVDDKCTGLPGRVVGHPGDINKNNLLDPGETFHFTCGSNITKTTTNIGTAEGHANGMTAIDFSPAVVVVAAPVQTVISVTTITPGLPNAGLPPHETKTPWIIGVLAGILAVISVSVVVFRLR